MNAKREVILLLIVLLPLISKADGISRREAKAIVENFYDGIKKMPKITVNDINSIKYEKILPNIINQDAFRQPNDVANILGGEINNSAWIRINTYLTYLQRWGESHNININYKVCDIKELREVSYEDKKECLVVNYWQLFVDKTVNIDGKSLILNDTVDIKIHNGKIAFISNKYYRSDSPVIKGVEGHEIQAYHDEMAARAARFWNQGRKREAFEAYVKSVENYEAPDIYFRIGLLLLKYRKSCTSYSKKEAQRMAYKYFVKAREKGHEEARRVIEWYFPESSGSGKNRGHAI